MATAKIAATPEINAEVMAQLIEMAGYVVGECTMGFMYRAEATQEDFLKDPTNPHWFSPDSRPGVLYADCDYAFRELMNPERRVEMAAEFERYNANRIASYGKPNCDALPVDVKATIRVSNEVLDAVALEQDADRLLPASLESGFWEEFIGEMMEFFESGEITDRS